jgi:hypothetical protein
MMNPTTWILEMWYYSALISAQTALAVLLHIPHCTKQQFVCCCVDFRSNTPFTNDAISLQLLHSTERDMPFRCLDHVASSALSNSVHLIPVRFGFGGATARSMEQHTNHSHVSRNSFWLGSLFGTRDNDGLFLWPSNARNRSVQAGSFESLQCWVDPWHTTHFSVLFLGQNNIPNPAAHYIQMGHISPTSLAANIGLTYWRRTFSFISRLSFLCCSCSPSRHSRQDNSYSLRRP